MAASLLLDVHASTLHHYTGILDGRYTNAQLRQLVNRDERFSSIVTNILATDVLIIDEMSMISAKVFEQAELVCRLVRDTITMFYLFESMIKVSLSKPNYIFYRRRRMTKSLGEYKSL